MREMRLAKREITDPEVLKEIVEECDTVRLGLTDAEGMFIVPVNYGYEFTEENGKAELQLYFHGAAEGRKADALKSQSPVAVEMDCRHGIITGDYTCAYSYSYRSIMGNGTVTLLETFEEKEKGLQRIMEHMAPGAKIEFRPEMRAGLHYPAGINTAVRFIGMIESPPHNPIVYEFTGKERKAK